MSRIYKHWDDTDPSGYSSDQDLRGRAEMMTKQGPGIPGRDQEERPYRSRYNMDEVWRGHPDDTGYHDKHPADRYDYRGPIGNPSATANAGLSRFAMARGHGGRMGTLDDVMGASPPNVGAGGGGRGIYRDGEEPLLMSGKGIMPQPSAPERGRGGLGIMPTPMQPQESYSRLMDSLSNKARSPGEAEAMLKQMWDHEPTDMMGEIIARAAKEIGVQPPWAQQKR